MDDVFAIGHGSSSGLSVDSLPFFAVSVTAILIFRLVPRPSIRGVLLGLLNLYVIAHFFQAWYPATVLVGLLAGTYALGEIHARFEARLPAVFPTIVTVGLWAFLFLIKDPTLFAPVNPFFHVPAKIVGISYLVFRAINYVQDTVIIERRSPLIFCNYMLFFPTLLAGPIERFDRFQQQWDSTDDEVRSDDILPALHRIANGLIKKYVLAENLNVVGLFYHADPLTLATPLMWLGALSQLALLYLDFSGYCDIVIGIGRLMGFRLVENFNRPWLAVNVQDFWNRWHMSLTHFIRDYAFVPMQRRVLVSIPKHLQFVAITGVYFLTMLLIALWHDTTWGFFTFGVLHGIALVLLQLMRHWVYPRIDAQRLRHVQSLPAMQWAARSLTYGFISMTMIFWHFGVNNTLRILQQMIGLS